jgi:hypothetical protein
LLALVPWVTSPLNFDFLAKDYNQGAHTCVM